MNYQKQVAKALLKIGAVKFMPREPVTLVSGIKTPVYVDNRKFIFHPEELRLIMGGFQKIITDNNLAFDIISGVEAGSIPYSSILGYVLDKPSVFVRKTAKGHGANKRIEGGNVAGQKVLLVEDLITFGTSSLPAIRVLREEGAIVDNCLAIVSYGFRETMENFKKEKVELHSLTSFPIILEEAVEQNKLSFSDLAIVEDWLGDPRGWAKKQGL